MSGPGVLRGKRPPSESKCGAACGESALARVRAAGSVSALLDAFFWTTSTIFTLTPHTEQVRLGPQNHGCTHRRHLVYCTCFNIRSTVQPLFQYASIIQNELEIIHLYTYFIHLYSYFIHLYTFINSSRNAAMPLFLKPISVWVLSFDYSLIPISVQDICFKHQFNHVIFAHF